MHEFSECIQHSVGATSQAEIDLLFKVCDRHNKGYLTVADIQYAFAHLEDAFNTKVYILPRDILVPLHTKLTKYAGNRTEQAVFESYKAADQKLRLAELSKIISTFLAVDLTEDEEEMLRNFLLQLSGSTTDEGLNEEAFLKLMQHGSAHQPKGADKGGALPKKLSLAGGDGILA